MSSSVTRAGLVLSIALSAGCAHYFVNAPLERYAPGEGYRYDATANTGSLCVCLAFSGGGDRAAALAYGVLEHLRDTQVSRNGEKKRLLDEVDCISAVSGGAFPAAYYALFGDRLFDDFPRRFFDRDIQGELERKVLRNSWWLWAAHRYKRSDLAQELYDETIFDRKTYGDLVGRRPFLILNATDMTNGQDFTFTQDQFDLLGSDLRSFPVARAVAASSAFPFLLSTITVQNHTKREGPPPGFSLPPGIRSALDSEDDDPRLAAWARHQARYTDPKGPPYLHLTDGGIADNTGLRALWVAMRRPDGFLRQRIERGGLERLVVIAVNAENDPLRGLGESESAPNVAAVLEKTARISVNNSTYETNRWIQEDPILKAMLARANVGMELIDVSFERLTDERRRETFLGLPTELRLDRAMATDVIAAGREILASSPGFRRLCGP